MRILYFITKSESGGAQSILFELAKGHRKRGDCVAFMAEPGGWLEDRVTELGYQFFPNSYIRNTIHPFRLKKIARVYTQAVQLFNPDIISCHSSVAGFVGRVSLKHSYPILFTARGWGFTDGVPWWRKIIARHAERYAARYCDSIICVSEFDRQLALKYAIAPSEKLITIHNGVDVLGNRAIPNADKDEVVIVFNGRIAVPKNQKQLVKAYAALPEAIRQKSRLLFVGGGPEQAELEALVHELALTDKVSITGEVSREEALQTMSTADVFVLLSNWEGYPVSIAEGLQMGLPVLASNVGGVSEMVDERVGVLLPRGERTQLLAEKLEKIIVDGEFRVRLAAEAYRRGNAYTNVDMSKKVFELYDQIIGNRKSHPYALTKLQKALRHGSLNIAIGQIKKIGLLVLYDFYHFDKWHSKRPVEKRTIKT